MVVVLVFGARALGTPVSLLRSLIRPVETVIGTVSRGVSETAVSLTRIGTLARRVRELETEIARLEGEVGRQASVEQENGDLRRALDLLPASPYQLVAAEVVGVTTDGVSTSLRLNKGTRQGVALNDPVIAPGGSVIGRVRDVQWGDALVELPTENTFRIAARALSTGAEGVVRGVRGLEVILEGVPRTQELRVGDQLVTTGLDGTFPPHLLIGTVESIKTVENAIFQEARVRLPISPRGVRMVAVVTGP